jgi:hypothetical protein
MSDLSTTETAFEGLRLTRERPRTVLWWWAAYIAASLIQFFIAIQSPFLRLNDQLTALQGQSEALQRNASDPAAAQQFLTTLGHIAGPMLLFAILVLLIQMVLSTAVLRAVLRPADRTAGYLRFGMDELRQLGLAMIVLFSMLVYAFVVSLASSLVIAVLSGLSGGAIPASALGAVAVAVIWIAFLYPAVRLSLAPAMTLADGRISFLRAWALTKNRFWTLLGAYAVTLAIAATISICGFMILYVITHLVFRDFGPSSPLTMQSLVSPAHVILIVGNGLLGALVGAVATAPIASAFRQITGRVGAPVNPTATVSNSGSPWGQP